jgi:hypothetical protein
MEIASWKVNGIYKADATKVAEEIKIISGNDPDNKFTPEGLVNYGKNPKTELHKCFEWNDAVAGECWRINQAQGIIRNLAIVVKKDDSPKTEPTAVRMFVSTGERDSTYKATLEVVQNVDEYKKLLQQAYADLQVFKKKYQTIKELANIIALIP